MTANGFFIALVSLGIFSWISSLSIATQAQSPIEPEETEVTFEDLLETPIGHRSCHNYCVLGACVWLRCTPFGCSVRTSLRVRHNNPDAVVSVYDEAGENPFMEARALYGDLEEEMAETFAEAFSGIPMGHGHRVEGGSLYADQSLRFHEATAVGHPLASLGDFLAQGDFFCPSEAFSMQPLFSSGLDALTWRLGIPEMAYLPYLLPGSRVVGEGGFVQQWGPVYPRTGFLLQKDYAKGAAVIAQRVGNIITQTGQPHVYWPLDGNNFDRTWLPGELIENNASTGVWQMVAPRQDNQCYAFGENDVFSEGWSQGRTSPDNKYVFNLWRPYTCCRDRGSLIERVNITPVCLPSL